MRNRYLASMALAIGLILATSACSNANPAPDTAAATLTLGNTSPPTNFDPVEAGEAGNVPYYQTPYDSLILRKPDGSYSPMLATDWELAEDNTSITLNLRTDVTFSDGEPFDAEVAKANLERFKAGTGPLSRQLIRLDTVKVVDKDTITLNYSAPDPDIIDSLSSAAGRMASPAAFKDAKSLATTPVGSGPYVMDVAATVPGSTYTFTAREGYWNPDLQKFAKIVFKIFPDEVSLLNALQSKQVDAGNIGIPDNRAGADAAGIRYLTPDANLAWSGIIFYDRTGALVPALGDLRVRKAIAKCFDVDAIQEALFKGTGVQTTQIFNQASPGYDPSLNAAYDYDLAAAKKLMQDAGYENGFDVTFPINSNTTPAYQENFRKSLGALNINVTFENLGITPQWFEGVQSGRYALSPAIFGSTPTDWVVMNNLLVEDAAWNPLKTKDPRLSALIKQYPSTPVEERGDVVKQINEFLVENIWFVPWLWLEERYYVATDIEVTLQTGQNVPSIYNYAPAGS